MTLQKKVVKHVQFQAVKYLANILYITGLTILIPLVPIVFSPSELSSARFAFGVAVLLVISSFFVIYFVTKSKKSAFYNIGFMTLFPGLLAVVFAYIGARRLAIFLGFFQDLSPFIQEWINKSVPKSWMLSGIYIIIGVLLIWISEQVHH